VKRILFWGVIVPPLLRRLVPRSLLEPPLILAARHPWITLAVSALGVVVGALFVSASGVVPIKASTGHWAVTEWFLQYSKTRSIEMHARWIDEPPLDDPALVLRGAGHYELGCRPCHGGAAGDVPRLAEFMLPPPPDLSERARMRTAAELFYVVKHGIKMTGMPAWPAPQRDDEVWAMAAFVRRLPGMTREEYERLTRGELKAPFDLVAGPGEPPVVAEICARCHGGDGLGRLPGAFPRLAGQRVGYLERALAAYAEGRRHSGVMGPIAAALTPAARASATTYYAALPSPPPAAPPHASSAAGARLALEGEPDDLIPACVECHGTRAAAKNPAYPILGGQDARYLSLQLRLLRNRARGGSEYLHLMHSFVDRLTDAQIDAVSRYFASLEPSP
jgi:cytochrome c553